MVTDGLVVDDEKGLQNVGLALRYTTTKDISLVINYRK